MIILQRPHQCLMHHVVRYVVVAASRVRAGAARAAPMGQWARARVSLRPRPLG